MDDRETCPHCAEYVDDCECKMSALEAENAKLRVKVARWRDTLRCNMAYVKEIAGHRERWQSKYERLRDAVKDAQRLGPTQGMCLVGVELNAIEAEGE